MVFYDFVCFSSRTNQLLTPIYFRVANLNAFESSLLFVKYVNATSGLVGNVLSELKMCCLNMEI